MEDQIHRDEDYGEIDDETLLLAEKDLSTPRSNSSGENRSATSPKTDSHPYRMTFGQHSGKTLEETPAEYIKWLLQNEIHHSHQDLNAALSAGGYFEPRHSRRPPYRFNFGLWRGYTLDKVPTTYIEWVIWQGWYADHKDLEQDLVDGGYVWRYKVKRCVLAVMLPLLSYGLMFGVHMMASRGRRWIFVWIFIWNCKMVEELVPQSAT